MKANDFILVHDANVNQVYEIPQEEIKAFIKEKYKGVDLEKEYDAIVFMTGSQTIEKKLTKVPMQYGDTKFTMDLTDEQIAQVKEILQTNSNKTELMGLVKISITLDNLEIKINAQTLKLIMQKLDTPMTKSVISEVKTMYANAIGEKFVSIAIVLVGIFFAIVMIALFFGIDNGLVERCFWVSTGIIVIMLLILAYVGIFIDPKL